MILTFIKTSSLFENDYQNLSIVKFNFNLSLRSQLWLPDAPPEGVSLALWMPDTLTK